MKCLDLTYALKRGFYPFTLVEFIPKLDRYCIWIHYPLAPEDVTLRLSTNLKFNWMSWNRPKTVFYTVIYGSCALDPFTIEVNVLMGIISILRRSHSKRNLTEKCFIEKIWVLTIKAIELKNTYRKLLIIFFMCTLKPEFV